MTKAEPGKDTPLSCPRCMSKMRKQHHARAVIDHCEACSGSFFDEGEMLSVLGKSADPEVWSRNNRRCTPSASVISCPRCHARMQLHPLGVDNIEVDIDFCAACGGVWLDGGEIDRVMQIGARKLAKESKAKKKAIDESAPAMIGRFLSMFPKE